MASDNSNKKELVSSVIEPVGEVELRTAPRSGEDDIYGPESDATTCSLESDPEGRGTPLSKLRAELHERSEAMNRLQYDIEQLRARWQGLETELSVREEITARQSSELVELRELLGRKDKQLQKRRSIAKKAKSAIRERHAELQATISGHEHEIHELRLAKESLEQTVEAHEATNYQQRLSDQEATISRHEQEILELRLAKESLEQTVEAHEAANYQQRLSEQEGRIAGQEATIRELEDKYSRAERYADSIRQLLQEKTDDADAVIQSRKEMQAALDFGLTELHELQSKYAISATKNEEIAQQVEQLEEAHREEIRMIRFELGEAQETATQHETMNEELVADLIETRGFQLKLEAMLEEKEQQGRTQIEEIEAKNLVMRTENSELAEKLAAKGETINSLLAENGELAEKLASRSEATNGLQDENTGLAEKLAERSEVINGLIAENGELAEKLASKNEAINSLLAELANKAEQISSIGEIKHVIEEIDERMSDQVDRKAGSDKDRVTRVLIGSVDGQELRFPLFKQKLTIGRTEQNDIQLRAPYISRRHAVIVTEGDITRVVDWGSKNGVFVNSDRVSEHFLENGDIVGIGAAQFRYEERPKRDA
jgi:chromosome segregation ATPase